VAEAPADARFIFALPVCDRNSLKSVHSIEWKNQEEAIYWLRYCGLETNEHEIVTPNEEIDIFAFIYERNFKNLLAKCVKR